MWFSNFDRMEKLLLSGLIDLLECMLLNFPLKSAACPETHQDNLHVTFLNLSVQKMGNVNVDESEKNVCVCVHLKKKKKKD